MHAGYLVIQLFQPLIYFKPQPVHPKQLDYIFLPFACTDLYQSIY